MSGLERCVEETVERLRERLGDGIEIVTATALPRGADPFVGGERPMLCASTRWASVPPGGVLVGGSPAAMAAVFGFDLPVRPEQPAVAPAPAAASASEEEGAGADEDASPAEDSGEDPASEADAAPAAAPSGPSWSSLVTDAARGGISPVAVDLAHHLAELAGLPSDCTPMQAALTDSPRNEVGPVPDGLVIVLARDGHEVRVVVVTPAILLARVDSGSAQGDPEAPLGGAHIGATPGPSQLTGSGGPIVRTLTEVPLDISLRVGRVHTSLASVLAMRDGDLLELDAAPDSPVDLVAGITPVASGNLEVAADGTLQLHVLRVDAARPVTLPPRTPHADVVGETEPEAPELRAIDGTGGGAAAAPAEAAEASAVDVGDASSPAVDDAPDDAA